MDLRRFAGCNGAGKASSGTCPVEKPAVQEVLWAQAGRPGSIPGIPGEVFCQNGTACQAILELGAGFASHQGFTVLSDKAEGGRGSNRKNVRR